MNPKKLLFMGYGYTARAVMRQLRTKNNWSFAGTTRARHKAQSIESDGVTPVIWNHTGLDDDVFSGISHLLVSTPPDEQGCPALCAAGSALSRNANQLKWIAYLSTNGVYGDHDGAWVTEDSALQTKSSRGQRRIKAEQDWQEWASGNNLPFAIFRLPGIYGPDRSALDSVRDGTAKRIYKEGQVFSRMHVDDIAGALAASMEAPLAHTLFNLADDEPAPPQDVVEFACGLSGVALPPLVPIEEANLSEMGRSFYADNKRVSNQKMKEALNFVLRYPTYREGLTAIYKQSERIK